jgi:hypothetical protein
MRDTELYEQLLGLERPWSVQAVTLKLEEEVIEVEVACSNRHWVCQECGKRMHLQPRQVAALASGPDTGSQGGAAS